MLWSPRNKKVSVFIQRSVCSTGVSHTQGAQAWITHFYRRLHQCVSLPRKRSPDGASTGCGHKLKPDFFTSLFRHTGKLRRFID